MSATEADWKMSRQRKWQWLRIRNGLCQSCGKPRGSDGTANNCRPCADINCERTKARYHRIKNAHLSPAEGSSPCPASSQSPPCSSSTSLPAS